MTEVRETIVRSARVEKRLHPEWRWGQTLFNVTRDLYPDLAFKVQGSIHDPFYQDDRADGFLDWVDRETTDD